MKIQTVSVVALFATTASSFQPHQRATTKNTALRARKEWWGPVGAAAVGWTLASHIAAASAPWTALQPMAASHETQTPSTLLAAKGELSYEKIDFSMPSYGASSFGFGDGQEARLGGGVEKGLNEKQLQEEAMRKAEAARQARLKAKNEDVKAREEEARTRAKAKKAEGDARVKELFGGI